MTGLLIAAPSSGSGKTMVTLGLLRAFSRRGLDIASAKAGPDYIDPAFHAAASGRPCVNLDPWAMSASTLDIFAADRGGSGLVVEAMMGLFDGAADGSASAADLAARLGLDVVLVVDCARQSHSVAALVRGFATHDARISLAGVILNRVGSPRHAAMLRDALAPLSIPVLGAVPRDDQLAVPERHLGLVQAGERADLDHFCHHAADVIENACEVEALARLAASPRSSLRATSPDAKAAIGLPPFGQRIAVARDIAFAFAYPHLLAGWRRQGAELSFFSPLAGEGPDMRADAVFLPGGYPELHAGQLAGASGFHEGMAAAVARGAAVYGECGGYMVLGEGLVDAEGTRHAMLGLLPVSTSFATRRLHLGYRRLDPLSHWPFAGRLRGHEFHYASTLPHPEAGTAPPPALFAVENARGEALEPAGLRLGSVGGSFIHLIDREEA